MEPISRSHLSWFERQGFAPGLVVGLWTVISFIGFQVVGAIVLIGALFVFVEHISDMAEMTKDPEIMNYMLFGNTVGQLAVLAAGSWLLARLATHRDQSVSSFLRLNLPSKLPVNLGLAVGLVLVLQPLIWFLGYLNSLIPFPEAYLRFEEEQNAILINYLGGAPSIFPVLFNVALIPAFCEELMMRGFFLRIMEQRRGIVVGIVVSSLIFGLYHIRLTQVIPLTLIGALLAFLTWKTKSLFPAMLAHFTNNATSIILARQFPDQLLSDSSTEFMPAWYWLALAALFSAFLFVLFLRINEENEHVQQHTSS